MKKLFVAGIAAALCGAPAIAADAPVKLPVKAAAAQHNWTGWYAGVNYGTGVAQTHGTTTGLVGSVDRSDTGYSVGAQVGYNWQYHPNWVAGVEADIGWLGIDRRFVDWNDSGRAFGVETDWYGTIRGRLGYTSSPSLFYVHGGGAFVHVKNRFDEGLVAATSVTTTKTATASGWTAGWGIETMLGGNWSAKAEYIYIDAGGQDVFNPGSGGGARTTHFDNRFHVFRKGLNYRFGGPGAPASALPAYNWTGFYAGVYAGAGLSEVHATTTVFRGAVDIADSAFTGGVQAGYNWQFHPQWVAGIEADIGWLGIDRTFDNTHGVANAGIEFGVESDWYATVRGRFGRSTGPALLYVTGGAAFVHVKNRFNSFFDPVFASNSKIATGWTVGGGIEAVLGNNWTAKTEYLLIDAGHQDVFNADTGFGSAGETAHFDNRFHVFRFGLNRKFGS